MYTLALVTVQAVSVDEAEVEVWEPNMELPDSTAITTSTVLLHTGDIVSVGVAPDGNLYLQDNDGITIADVATGTQTRNGEPVAAD